jgi:hypothetical protein
MAEHLGLDYSETFYRPPLSEADRVFGAIRCGASLLTAFTRSDGWPDDSGGGLGGSKRTLRKAAKHFTTALQTEDGHDAVAWLAQSYGRTMAATWRAAAQPDPGEAERLLDLAEASDALSELVRQAWPVSDYHHVLSQVEREEQGRLFDPDNPEATVDLRAYAARAGVMARAVALVMGSSYADFAFVIVAPLYSLHLTYSVGMLADWAHVTPGWVNLLRPDPESYVDLVQRSVDQQNEPA